MFVLDTNVISELRKANQGKADVNVVRWADSVEPSKLYISAISIQELEIGVLLVARRDRKQGAVLIKWFENQVLPAFFGRILSADTAVARLSARLNVPDPKPVRDGLIAATALLHRMKVVTRNVADFQTAGVEVLNPWVAA